MKKITRWIMIILAVVLVLGACTSFVDYRLKASETNGDTAAQEQQDAAEEAQRAVEVVVPPVGESDPVELLKEPAEELAEVSVEKHTEELAEEPVEEPAEELAEEPVEEFAEELTEEPAEEPAEELAEEPVEEPAEELAEEPVEEPAEELAEEPVEEPAEELAEEPAEEPAEELAEEPAEEPAEELAEEPVEEPEEEPVEEAAEKSVTENIVVSSISINVPSYTYCKGEGLNAELIINAANADGVLLNKFIVEITKTNSAVATDRFTMNGYSVLRSELVNGVTPFEYKFDFIPFDGDNETASLMVVIMDTDEEETVLAAGTVTFEKTSEEINNEATEDNEPAEEPVEEEHVEEESVAGEPVKEEPVEEESVAGEPVEEESVAEEPVEEEPIEEESVDEELVAEELDEEEPVDEESVVEPTFGVEFDKDPATLVDGDTLTMSAVITGLENVEYVVIWQVMDEDGEWINEENGIGIDFTINVNEVTRGCIWRYVVESV